MSFKLSELLNPAPSTPVGEAAAREEHQSTSHDGEGDEVVMLVSPPQSRTLPSPETAPVNLTDARSATHARSDHDRMEDVAYYGSAYTVPGLAQPASQAESGPLAGLQDHALLAVYTSPPSARRQTAFSVPALPVEPSPSIVDPTTQNSFSPTLEQYHHGSKSPEELRRQAQALQESPTRLAPIQALTQALNDNVTISDSSNRVSFPPFPPHSNAGLAFSGIDFFSTARAEPSNPDLSTKPEPEPTLTPLEKMKVSSPPPHIKEEADSTLVDEMPLSQRSGHHRKSTSVIDADPATQKAIEEAKNEYSLRGSHQKFTTEASSPSADCSFPLPPVPPPTAAAAPKKRAPPKSAAANKKGTAKKPPNRRKGGSDAPSAATSRSTKMKGEKDSKSNTPALGSSPGPDDSFDADDGSDYSSAEVFCVCRKGDDHTWMIACDGGCEDWFHGKCVGMDESRGDLIDKYICPNCEKEGKGVTTYKPNCRTPGCQKPANLSKSNPSKYCSAECGLKFFHDALKRTRENFDGDTSDQSTSSKATPKRTKRKANTNDNSGTLIDPEVEDHDSGPKGGPLSRPELKALVTASQTSSVFRKLGDGVISPVDDDKAAAPTGSVPSTIAKLTNTAHDTLTPAPTPTSPAPKNATPDEVNSLNDISHELNSLRSRLELTSLRKRFVWLAREAFHQRCEKTGIKAKDVCGFDKRLSWSDDTFARWSTSEEGKTALGEGGVLPDPENMAVLAGWNDAGQAGAGAINGTGADAGNGDGANRHINGGNGAGDADRAQTSPKQLRVEEDSICNRKRCERHRTWATLAVSNLGFEIGEMKGKMRDLEGQKEVIRERAARRARVENATGEGGLGWVEMAKE